MRIACDTGGTFTDLVVETVAGLKLFKASTTPADPVQGVLNALTLAAADAGVDRDTLLGRTDTFIHGTTRAINAILTGGTARTAFLTTAGHPDILVIREGGRTEPFNFTVPYPEPYVPRALTFEVPERVDSAGAVVRPLDEVAVVAIAGRLRDLGVEAVAVCLLWAVANPVHERRVGALLGEHLPGIPVTLSHELNPGLREYRRASSACIDASLKPLMGDYLGRLEARLREAGLRGRLLMVTSQGGVMDAAAVAAAPIHAINSGPAMAPVAGRLYAQRDAGSEIAIVADTGGTSYDVSLVRQGRIPWTREAWLGPPFRGHMTGFPSVDVKSIGAGGGSIAWVDGGGLLRVGPQSAGSTPGPACYGRGGNRPTLTDCCLVLGWLDPDFFLGGAMRLDLAAAQAALRAEVADPLGMGLEDAAHAVVELATEKMVGAIEEITVNQGIDPGAAVLVGGGGAAGLNTVAVGRRLGCAAVLIPETGAALSAAGALMSDLHADFGRMLVVKSGAFDRDAINAVLADLEGRCQAFRDGPGRDALASTIELFVEARYPHQIWEIEVPLRVARFAEAADLDGLLADFHATHRQIFAIADELSPIELVTWRARVRCTLRAQGTGTLAAGDSDGSARGRRRAWFRGPGWVEAETCRFAAMRPDETVTGPAIVESSFTTIVVDPGATARRTAGGGLTVSV
jgi:N-methylhydantoinase A